MFTFKCEDSHLICKFFFPMNSFNMRVWVDFKSLYIIVLSSSEFLSLGILFPV